MKNKKVLGKAVFNNLLLLTSLVLWVVVFIFAYMVLKSGGHLAPRAADLETLGTIVGGVVVDSGGTPINGAKITVFVGENKSVYLAGESGKYRIVSLLEGEYNLVVSKPGYSQLKAKLVVGHRASEQNFTLRVN